MRPGSQQPATGVPLSNVVWDDTDSVQAAVGKARAAQAAWADRTLDQRGQLMLDLGKRIVENRDEVLAILTDEMGRDPAESLLGEVAFAYTYAKGALKVARVALAAEKVKLSPIDFPGKRAVIEAVPRGVIGIIEPWNYPLLQFLKPLFPALLSGNAVVLKPSEHTPRTGAWLKRQCDAVLPPGLVQLVQGDGAVGQALVDADIDALVFCGSVATGRAIARACAEKMIPCSVELGGKDAAIILDDAELDRTVAGVCQWAMHNAGQDCSSIERIYVTPGIADRFVAQLGRAVGRLTVAPVAGRADMGPLQNARQLEIVAGQVSEAIAAGAVAVCGGGPTGKGNGFQPTVLDQCTQDMRVVREETFGPVVAVVRVRDIDEAVRLANDCAFGLCGSVWTKDSTRGEAIARRLDVGLALVNNHSFPGSLPQVPWTGTKHTGTGTAASRFSYDTFVRRRTLVVDTSTKPDVFWKPIDDDLMALGDAVSELSLGGVRKVISLIGLLGKRTKAILDNAR